MVLKIVKCISFLLVVFFGGALILLSSRIGGIRAFVVMSASMEPAVKTGSLLITRTVNPKDLVKNDIVTFIRPDKSREFITHRIVEQFENKGTLVFKTKGDNNDKEDGWLLAEGGIVGKVITIIPHLGYILSLARTKIGIMFLIIIPAILIIVDEIKTIINLFRNKEKSTPTKALETITILCLISTLSLTGTNALLTHSVDLTNNIYTIAFAPTPTPSPTPLPTSNPTPSPTPNSSCNNSTSIVVSGNGAGSTNTVTVSEPCNTETSSSNEGTNITTINSSSETGNNSASSSTGGNVTVQTGSAENNVTVIESGNISGE